MSQMRFVATAVLAAISCSVPVRGQEGAIERRLVRTIGNSDGPGSFSTKADAFARLSDGRLIIAEANELPVVFDSSGRFIKVLGPRGKGPGEFEGYVSAITVIAGDTVLVSNGPTVKVFGPKLGYIRDVRIGSEQYGLFASVGRGFVVSSQVRTGRVTNRLHIVDDANRTVHSFAPDTANGAPLQAMRVTSGDSTNFWARPIPERRNRHRIEHWSTQGMRLGVIDTTPVWWTSGNSMSFGPAITGLRQVGSLLWVASVVPAPDADRYRPTANGDLSIKSFEWDKIYNSYLEVYDVATRRLLASQSAPGNIVGFLDDAHYLRYIVDDGGIPRLEEWEMRFKSSRR